MLVVDDADPVSGEPSTSPEDVPDPQDVTTFERSKLDWNELGQSPHDDILEWYRGLIRLRRSLPELRDDRLDRVAVTVENACCLVVRRGRLTVA